MSIVRPMVVVSCDGHGCEELLMRKLRDSDPYHHYCEEGLLKEKKWVCVTIEGLEQHFCPACWKKKLKEGKV